MSMEIKWSCIGEGINLTEIYDSKFKTTQIRINFISPVSRDTLLEYGLAGRLMVTSNAAIPSRTELSRRLSGLYGAYVTSAHYHGGNYQTLSLTADFISDRYTIDGEVISEEVTGILLDCLIRPDFENGAFREDYFRLRLKDLRDAIAANINDKRSYGYELARSIAYRGEMSGISKTMLADRLDSLTPQSVAESRERLIAESAVEIYLCSGEECSGALKMLKNAAKGFERRNVCVPSYKCPSPAKAETERAEKAMELNQSKLYMAFKSDYEGLYEMKVFQAVFGATPMSRLFLNVREKLSLCYYCSAGYNEFTNTIMVDSGVDSENLEKTQEAILEQLKALAGGEITDEELEDTKRFLCGLYKTNTDSVSDTLDWYETQQTRGTDYDPAGQCSRIMQVTKEQITECAKSLKLDTVFILKAEEVEA